MNFRCTYRTIHPTDAQRHVSTPPAHTLFAFRPFVLSLFASRFRAHSLFASRLFVLPLLALSLLASCTDNPLEDGSAVQASHRKISGKVRLSDRPDHSGAYLWLEGFDLHTVSRVDGGFSLTLPPASAQSTPGGNDGVFRLYAFLGNYRLQSVKTAVRQGAFSFPSDDIDNNGDIINELFLQQLFSIETTLSRSRIEADSPRVITLNVILRTPLPPVQIYFPRLLNGIEGPVLLHNKTTGEVRIYRTTVTSIETTDYVDIGPTVYTRSMILIIPKDRLKAGEYEIIPYMLPRNVTVPLGLLSSLGENVAELGAGYLAYPFLREGGRLIVD